MLPTAVEDIWAVGALDMVIATGAEVNAQISCAAPPIAAAAVET